MPKIVDNQGHALKAILLLVLVMSFIPQNDVLIKVMSKRLPLAEIVAMRGIMSLGILIYSPRCTFGFDVGSKNDYVICNKRHA